MTELGQANANSVWVFLLLASEAIKTFRTNPYFQVGTLKVPTWTTPLVVSFVVAVLLSNTSFLGHICGMIFGYLRTSSHALTLSWSTKCGNSWTGLPQSLRTTRENPALHRRKVEPPRTTSSLRLRRPKDARTIRCPPHDVLWRVRRCDEQLYWLIAAIGTVNIDCHVG